jgi:hypothetical protein
MAYGVNYRSYAREGTNPTNSEIPWHKTKYDYGQNELWLHGDIFLKISNPTFEDSKKKSCLPTCKISSQNTLYSDLSKTKLWKSM